LGRKFSWDSLQRRTFILLESLNGNSTRFRQIERFHGPMVLFMGSMIKKTEKGYHQMNIALKKRVEEVK